MDFLETLTDNKHTDILAHHSTDISEGASASNPLQVLFLG
jgi:hypothetical protein